MDVAGGEKKGVGLPFFVVDFSFIFYVIFDCFEALGADGVGVEFFAFFSYLDQLVFKIDIIDFCIDDSSSTHPGFDKGGGRERFV